MDYLIGGVRSPGVPTAGPSVSEVAVRDSQRRAVLTAIRTQPVENEPFAHPRATKKWSGREKIVLPAIFGGGVRYSDAIMLVRFGVIQVTDTPVDLTLDFVTSLDRATTDDVLLAATGRGDREALAQLYARHAPWLILRLGRKCPDAGIVDEVMQDTFLAVWRNARQWDSRGEVAAWIWGIAVRRLIDALRRRPSIGVSLDDLPDAAGIPEPSAEDQVLMGGEYGDVALALQRLPPDLYAVVRATVVDGLTTRETAQLLGIPVGTVKTRMMRARFILRKELT